MVSRRVICRLKIWLTSKSNALLKGNVTTGRLSISEGAKLRGAIQVKIDDTEEDLFDEPISVAPIAAEPAVETPVAKNQQ